jgi:hypothetical protein
MSSDIGLDVNQLKKDIKNVQRNLDLLKGQIGKSSRQALQDTIFKVGEVVSPNVPVLTGVLKSSYFGEPQTDYLAEGGFNTDYATKVNYVGKSKGYFSDPFKANSQNFIDFFEERFVKYYL